MKNWIMSMTSTPHSPECAAKTTFSTPTISSVCHRVEPEQNRRDLARGEVHRGHDHAVEEQAEVHRAEPADDAGGLARVADLVELEIGQHARPPPQPRVEEHGRDAGQHERPPHPVAGHAVAPHDVGDEVRRVAAEGRGHHRQAGQPPRHRAAGGEELRRVLAGAPAEEQRRREADDQGGGHDQPVEQLEPHRGQYTRTPRASRN